MDRGTVNQEYGRSNRGEHLHRYLLARHLTRGLDVLDIASGEGYGSAILAQTAHSVIGVEIDRVTVEHAKDAYAAQNLRFVEGSAQSIPLDDQSVDCVVSFETIEHLYDQELFLSEIRRVLKTGGKLIISLLNRDIYSSPGGPSNRYHIRELTRNGGLRKAPEANFEHVTLLGQRPIVGSAIVQENAADCMIDSPTFERLGGGRHFEASTGFDRPLYCVAIASDIMFQPLPESFYFERGTVDDVMVALSALRLEHQSLQGRVRQLEGSITEKDALIGGQMQAIRAAEESITHTDAAINAQVRTIKALEATLERSAPAPADSQRRPSRSGPRCTD